MKKILFTILFLTVAFCGAPRVCAQTADDVQDAAVDETVVEETIPAPQPVYPEETTDNKEVNQKFWRGGNKVTSLGYTTGSFDLGGTDDSFKSRWGLTFRANRNVYFHKSAIAGLVKIGLKFGLDVNYMNFEKGHGNLSDVITGGDGYDDSFALGKHYVTGGLAIGPTVTVMPFAMFSDADLARIKIRPYFNVVPSYSAFIVSDEDDMEVHGAFTCFFSGGFEIIWRKLSLGFEWKSGKARYKDLVGDLMDEIYGEYEDGLNPLPAETKKPKSTAKMFTISIGLAF